MTGGIRIIPELPSLEDDPASTTSPPGGLPEAPRCDRTRDGNLPPFSLRPPSGNSVGSVRRDADGKMIPIDCNVRGADCELSSSSPPTSCAAVQTLVGPPNSDLRLLSGGDCRAGRKAVPEWLAVLSDAKQPPRGIQPSQRSVQQGVRRRASDRHRLLPICQYAVSLSAQRAGPSMSRAPSRCSAQETPSSHGSSALLRYTFSGGGPST